MLLLGQLFPEHWDYSAVCHHRHSRLCHDVWWMHLLTWQGMCWKQWSSGICNIRFVHQKLHDVRFSIVKCKLTYHMLWPAQSPTFTNTLHPSNGLFSSTTSTTWLSWYQKGKTSLDLNEARGDGVWGWQWHQLDHMQTVCTSLQTENHTNTSSLNFTGRMLFLMPNQQCQSTSGKSTGTENE